MNPQNFPAYFFVGAIIFVGAILYYAYLTAKKRREALLAVSRQIGFQYLESDPGTFFAQLAPFQLATFGKAYSRKLFNILKGRISEGELILADYRYTSGSGKNKHTRNQTIMLLQSDKLSLPQFELRPENFFDKLADTFGFKDIDLPQHPEFSKTFLIKGAEQQHVQALFSPTVITYLMQNRDLHIEGSGNQLLIYRYNRITPAEQVSRRREEASQIARLFMR
ncbi:hypothetical protein JNK13_01280 [bacterium]|nr:hypothetical protein [bacterium]